MGLSVLKSECMHKIALAQLLQDEGLPPAQAWRLALGISQAELARRLDAPIEVVAVLECQRDPVPDAQAALARALGMSVTILTDPGVLGDMRGALERAPPAAGSMDPFFLPAEAIARVSGRSRCR